MASLDGLARLYQKKKESVDLEKKIQKNLKNARSAEKRLSTRIALLEKKMDAENEYSDDLSAVLLQRASQLSSIGRLVDGAKQRLSAEKDEIADIQQNLASAGDSAGEQNARDRLKQLVEHVGDLASEIARREKTAEKVTKEIAQYTKTRSKSASKIQKQAEMKTSLESAMADARGMTKDLARDLEKQTRAVASAERTLAKETQRLQNVFANKSKTASAKKPAKTKKSTKPKPAKKSSKKQAKSKKSTKPAKNQAKPATKPKPVSGRKKK